MSLPKYPKVKVTLSELDGNAFFILACVQKALRKGGVEEREIATFLEMAEGGDYDNLLRVCMDWVTVS
jgi:hypothetical protein